MQLGLRSGIFAVKQRQIAIEAKEESLVYDGSHIYVQNPVQELQSGDMHELPLEPPM